MGEDGFYYRDGEKVGFVISVGTGDQVRVDIAQIAAQQLQQIGMDVTVEKYWCQEILVSGKRKKT